MRGVLGVVVALVGAGACRSPTTLAIDATAGPDDAALDDAPGDGSGHPGSRYTYVKASNPDGGDGFGNAIAVSDDGNTIAIGSQLERSNGDPADNSVEEAGAVYVYARTNGIWAQQAYLKPQVPGPARYFGSALAISGDGNVLVIGSWGEASCAVGIDGDQADHSCGQAGAAFVFERSTTTWTQTHYLKPSNTTYSNGYQHYFGRALALSNDGTTLAVAGPGDCSDATGIDGVQTDISAPLSGAVYVFTRGATWQQQAYVKASNTGAYDGFGVSVALSADGSVLAVGALGDDSGSSGVDGSQLDNLTPDSGSAFVFKRTGTTWTQQAYVKASNPDANDNFGTAIALSGAGTTLVVGAANESSSATGINGDQTDNSQLHAGALYAFDFANTEWTQSAYIKGPTSMNGDAIGLQIALAKDGSTIAVGAAMEDGGSTGFTMPDPPPPRKAQSGAVYTFVRAGVSWQPHDYIKASNTGENDIFGTAVELSADAHEIVVGAPGEASTASGIGGDQTIDAAPGTGAAYVIE